MNKEDVELILSHFGEPLFPRKMMTYSSNGQFAVTSKEEILQRCKEANYIDCRINAYPEYIEYRGIVRQPPNFIFIDLDKSHFSRYKDPVKILDSALSKALKNISSTLGQRVAASSYIHDLQQQQHNQKHYIIKPIRPTVMWSGNGYHIYLPIKSVVLDTYDQFSKGRFPTLFSSYNGKYFGSFVSEVFLKYAEDLFTEGKADPQHKPRYKSCLIRFPNTYNSKCLARGMDHEKSMVKVIQEWNCYRPPIQPLTKGFRRWITEQEIHQKILVRKNPKLMRDQPESTNSNKYFQINWIEKLLKTGIPDGRKETLRLILGPYLTKRKSHEESESILIEWLKKCNDVEQLDNNFNPKQRINASLKNSKGFLKLESLKLKQNRLYNVIKRFLI